jgi:tetratricopeptide (TPR) repeat protein
MNGALWSLCLLFIATLLLRADDERRVADLYSRALAGDKAAVADCIAALDSELAQRPNDQLARVYLGSTWTLRSRDLPIGPGKLAALRRGLTLMDQAAQAAPDDLKVLLVRAITRQALPGFLGQRSTARQEIEELVARVELTPQKLDAGDRQLLYLNAGRAAQQAGEKERARQLWRRGLTIEGDIKLRAELTSELAK